MEIDYFDYCLFVDLVINEVESEANALVKECRANADALDAWEDSAERNGYRIR